MKIYLEIFHNMFIKIFTIYRELKENVSGEIYAFGGIDSESEIKKIG